MEEAGKPDVALPIVCIRGEAARSREKRVKEDLVETLWGSGSSACGAPPSREPLPAPSRRERDATILAELRSLRQAFDTQLQALTAKALDMTASLARQERILDSLRPEASAEAAPRDVAGSVAALAVRADVADA